MIKVEYWEDIADKWYLVTNGTNGMVVKEETDLKDPELILRFKTDSIPLAKARTKLFQHYVSSRVSVTPFDVKQYFLKKIDLENHKKADRLTSDHPRENFRQIKTEINYFGKSFLKGFLEIYLSKLNAEVNKFEESLRIMGEINLGGDEESFNIVKPAKGEIEIVVSGFFDLQHARDNLDRFLNGY